MPKEQFLVEDAIKVAHEAGAIAVWAHPGSGGRRERMERMIQAGLDGAEVLHPGHSPEDTARLRALVDFFGILPSGGSDWHGATNAGRRLGMMNVPLEWLERQDVHRDRINSMAVA